MLSNYLVHSHTFQNFLKDLLLVLNVVDWKDRPRISWKKSDFDDIKHRMIFRVLSTLETKEYLSCFSISSIWDLNLQFPVETSEISSSTITHTSKDVHRILAQRKQSSDKESIPPFENHYCSQGCCWLSWNASSNRSLLLNTGPTTWASKLKPTRLIRAVKKFWYWLENWMSLLGSHTLAHHDRVLVVSFPQKKSFTVSVLH